MMPFISKGQSAVFLIAIAMACLSMPVTIRAELERHPKQIGASIDIGQVEKGKDEQSYEAKGTVITRTGVFIAYSATYDKKLDISLVVGGLFWYPFVVKANQPYERLLHFGPGLGLAQATYAFGDPAAPAAKLQFGYFPLKYNPDSKNLGEYLYRSGTYPGYIWNGGWSYINSSSYAAEGAHLTVPTFGGKIIHDFTLFLERDIEPTGDFSPGYVLTVKPFSFLELGGGVVWAHALSFNPDKLTPKDVRDPVLQVTAYDKRTGLPLTPYDYVDTSTVCLTSGTCTGIPSNALGYYTFKGLKTMARVSMDFGTLMKVDAISPGDFKLYAEWALLGVQNQPFYYAHRSERMPIMLGLDIPTFKLLDKLSFEVEYHKSRFSNTIGYAFDKEVPIPLDIGESYLNYTDSVLATKNTTRDDWHWSVYAHRRINEGMGIYAQAASDNQRGINGEIKPSAKPTTLNTVDWYYVVRLEFGIF